MNLCSTFLQDGKALLSDAGILQLPYSFIPCPTEYVIVYSFREESGDRGKERVYVYPNRENIDFFLITGSIV